MTKTDKTILIVDDNPVMQKLFQRLLKNSGFTTFAAYTGEECLEKVKTELPSIILMDVILIDGNGKDIVRQLRADPETEGIPVIFTTNTLDLQDDDGYQMFEIDGHKYRAFAKPPHYAKLLSAIRKEINRSIHGGELPPEKNSDKD